MRHVYEVLQLLSVMEHDDRYEQAAIEERAKGEIRNMSNVIDRYIKEGEARKEAEVNERVATDMLKERLPLIYGYGGKHRGFGGSVNVAYMF